MTEATPARRKGLLFYALLCACIGVWSYVLYQVTQGVHQTYDLAEITPPVVLPAPDSTHRTVRPGPRTTYRGDFGDPFTLPATLTAPPPAPQRRAARPPPPKPPALRVTGIVGDTALLHDEAGASYVVRTGEWVGDVRLVHVEPNHIVIRSSGHSFTLELRQ